MRNHTQPFLYGVGRRNALLFAVVIAFLSIAARPANAQAYHWPMHIGVRCQSDFQNIWAPTVNPYPACGNFINQISKTDYLDFYYNLHGGAAGFTNGNGAEICNGCGGVDSVDFFLVYTHGTIANNDANYAGYAMWDDGSIAWTPQMRFGAAGKDVQVFSSYSCDTMKTSDGLFWSRWNGAMSGGVKIVTGAHDLFYDDYTNGATSFAQRMQNGESIGSAWLESTWYADNNNHPSEANTGANAQDCWNRAGATMQSVQTMPALRDSQIRYVCWAGWNGD
jgi:Family of unknown function (DUF6345)